MAQTDTAVLLEKLRSGALDSKISALYGSKGLEASRGRLLGLIERFESHYSKQASAVFSSPGRAELGGNHTDHQRGCVLAGSVSADKIAAVALNGTDVIRIHSEGFSSQEISLSDDLRRVREGEEHSSTALVRGIASRICEFGFEIRGFDAYVLSDVPSGSGLSSSASFEVLVAGIINEFFCGGALSPIQIAEIGQYAENVFFGKPSGLMDQMTCAVGGVVAIDFGGVEPKIEQLTCDLESEGFALCVVHSGAGHQDLTEEYSAIANEMSAVARFLGGECLSEISEIELHSRIPDLRIALGDRAILRAIHYFGDTCRAAEQAKRLKVGDFSGFLRLVNESGRSSVLHLQNVVASGSTQKQELALTLALCEKVLAGRGACRVHGGGFGGTALVFAPLDLLDKLRLELEAVLGSGCCEVVSLRAQGFCRVI